MFSRAELFQVGHRLGVLQRQVPIRGGGQKYRNWQLGLDIHLNIAAVRERTISQARVIVRGVEPHALVIAREPAKNSLLAKRRSGESTSQNKREKEGRFAVFHGNSIGT